MAVHFRMCSKISTQFVARTRAATSTFVGGLAGGATHGIGGVMGGGANLVGKVSIEANGDKM